MSRKEQFEYIENRIKQAAESSQQDADGQAWQKMEALLDEEKKQRPFLWWLILPLLLAGIWGAYKLSQSTTNKTENTAILISARDKKISTPDQQAISTVSNEVTIQADKAAGLNQPGNAELKTTIPQENIVIKKKIISTVHKDNAPALTDIPAVHTADNNSPANDRGNVLIPGKKIINNSNTNTGKIIAEKKDANITFPITMEKKMNDMNAAVQATVPPKKQNELTVSLEVQNNQVDSLKNSIASQGITKKDNGAKRDKKVMIKDNKKAKGFYFLASGGIDAASVKLFSFTNSTIAAKYGIGAGYQLNNRWSVQTGLYAAKKKYIAGPGDYHPKTGSYWGQVQITRVNANCLVYEVPVSLRYNFINSPTVILYGMVGSSSYIMKEEDYDYYYIRDNMPHEKYWEYTGNKYLFSVLNISAGIEKKLSSTFSLLAEPSVSIPVSGVGDGKVKLFSAALQIILKYRPFNK